MSQADDVGEYERFVDILVLEGGEGEEEARLSDYGNVLLVDGGRLAPTCLAFGRRVFWEDK